jgi:2-keto-3-deoxy-L-rhamnonate aldolase RhmA
VNATATYENRAKRKLAAGELVLCLGLRQARTVDVAMIAAAGGFDAIYVDMEHSPISLETTSMLCAAATGIGVTALVRVPSLDAHWISRALDGGAQGVILPHVNTPQQALAIVAAARFPPVGHRSVMGATPALGYGAQSLGEIIERLNREALVIAMLETPEGIANADAIAAIPGIDMLLIGSNDLCTEMGIPGQLNHPGIREAYRTTAAACRAHGKVLGVGGISKDIALQTDLVRMGARFLIAGSDVSLLLAAAIKDVATLREIAY